VGLGPTAVVRLERALAHSWAPGLLAGAWGTGCRSMRGTARCLGLDGRSPPGAGPDRCGHAAAAVDERDASTVRRPGRAGQTSRPRPAGRRAEPRIDPRQEPTPGLPGDRHAVGRRKTAHPGCGQPLAGGPPASLVSRGSPGSSPPVVRGISPNQGRGSGHTGATDVHRLWTTVWTVHSCALGEPGLRSSLPTQDGAAGPWPEDCSMMPTAADPRPAADETTRGAQCTSGRDSA
jgi:hypothetical protein